jgi:peptide/nickel transport system permease protein
MVSSLPRTRTVNRAWRAQPPLLRLTFGRFAAGLLTVWLASVLVFAATEVLPGDAASAILGKNATPETLASLREQLGLESSAVHRYWDWFTGLLGGDLGTSLVSDQTVWQLIGHRMLNSLVLAGATMIVLVPLALLLGTVAAVRQYRPTDHLIQNFTLILNALPEFVTGTLLALIFGVTWPILPAVSLFDPADLGYQHPKDLVLPVATLVLAAVAPTARMVRGSVMEVLDRPYIQMAHLKGIGQRAVLRRHVLPNALVPTVQVIALSTAWLLGGIVVVEFVFQYPGIGQALVSAVSERDVPTVQALGAIVAAVYVVLNLTADVVTILLTPRLRTSL